MAPFLSLGKYTITLHYTFYTLTRLSEIQRFYRLIFDTRYDLHRDRDWAIALFLSLVSQGREAPRKLSSAGLDLSYMRLG